MKFNSVVFHTVNLVAIREFYEGLLGLKTGMYMKAGVRTNDFSDSYVNYYLDGGGLLGFEVEHDKSAGSQRGESERGAAGAEIGTIILNTEIFLELRERLEAAPVKIIRGNEHYFMIHDPDGRTLIFEPQNQ